MNKSVGEEYKVVNGERLLEVYNIGKDISLKYQLLLFRKEFYDIL